MKAIRLVRSLVSPIPPAGFMTMMVVNAGIIMGPAHVSFADEASHLYQYQARLIDNTDKPNYAYQIFERPLIFHAFTWGSSSNPTPYFALNAGTDVLIYNANTGNRVATGGFKFGNGSGTHGVANQLMGVDVCNGCRYLALTTLHDGAYLINLGDPESGAVPTISQAGITHFPDGTDRIGGTYKIAGTQYILAAGADFTPNCPGALGVYEIPQGFDGTNLSFIGCADPSIQPRWGEEISVGRQDGNGSDPFFVYYDPSSYRIQIVPLTPAEGQQQGIPGLPMNDGYATNTSDPLSLDTTHLEDQPNPVGYLLICNGSQGTTLYKMTPNTSWSLNISVVTSDFPDDSESQGDWHGSGVHFPYVFLMNGNNNIGGTSPVELFKVTKDASGLWTTQKVNEDYWNNPQADYNSDYVGDSDLAFDTDAAFSPDGASMYWARFWQLEQFKYQPESPTTQLTVTPSQVFWGDTVYLDGSQSFDAAEYAAWIDDDRTGLSSSANVVAGTQVLGSGDAGWQTGSPALTWLVGDNAEGPYYAHLAVQDTANGHSYDPANHPEMLKTVQINFSATPQASFDAPSSVLFSTTKQTTITNTSQGHPTAYDWTVTAPGSADGTFTGPDTQGNITVVFDQTGDWKIDLTANYKASYSSSAQEATVTVKSAIASFTISPGTPVTTEQSILLDGSDSQSNSPLTYQWDIQDDSQPPVSVWPVGLDNTTKTVTIPAGKLDAGTYTVTLTVSNDAGHDVADQTLTVTNPPPQTLNIRPTSSPDRGQAVQFTVTGLTLNSDSVVHWTFGGPSCDPSSEPQSATCEGKTWDGFLGCDHALYHYSTAGSYNVTVSGTDANGSFSVNGQVQVQANGQCSGTSCTYSLSVNPSQFAASGGSGTVTVTTSSGCSWNISDNATWLNLSTASGSGTKTLTATAAANTGAIRTATITLKDGAGNVKATASMSQAPASGSGSVDFTYSPTKPKVGETVQFTVTAGSGTPKSWNFGQANCNGDSPSISNCSFLGNFCSAPTWDFSTAGTVNVTLTTDFGSVTKVITVADGQCNGGGGTTCTPALNPSMTQFPGNGGNGAIGVSVDDSCSWTATSNKSWLQITAPESTVEGNGTVRFTVGSNDTGQDRSGTITVLGKKVTISQLASSGGGGGGSLNAQSLVPAAANIAGKNGTHWKTELCVFNPNPSQQATFEVKLLDSPDNSGGGTPVGGLHTVGPLGTWCNPDVLNGPNQVKGALTVELQHDLPLGLAVTSRTYTLDPNNTGTGTYGQFVPALSLAGTPVRQLILTGLHSWGDIKAGEGFRTNLGLVNQSDKTTPRIVITVYDDAGTPVGTYKSGNDLYTALGPHGFIQFDDPIIDLLDKSVPNGLHDFSIVISFTNSSGDPLTAEVTAYATVVDNATGDATFIPAVAIP